MNLEHQKVDRKKNMSKKKQLNQKSKNALQNNANPKSEHLQEEETLDTITIGEYLKNLRKSANLELSQIASRTKINHSILKLLEDNRFDKLPNITYLRGFIKSFAKEVQGDINESLDILEETYYKVKKGEKKKVAEIKEEPAKPSIEFNPEQFKEVANIAVKTFKSIPTKYIKTSVAIIIGLLFVGYFVNKISNFEAPEAEVPKKHITSPESKTDAPVVKVENKIAEPNEVVEEKESNPKTLEAKKTAPPIESEKKVEVVAKDKIEVATKEPEVKPAQKESKEVVKLGPYKFNSKPELTDMVLPLYKVLPNSPDNENTEYLPQRIKDSFVEGTNNVFINAFKEDSWLTYKNNDGKIKTFVLKKGRTLLIRGDLIQLFLGNVHGTKIFLNNQLLKIDSKNGVKSLVFPQTKAEEFKTPLFLRDLTGKRLTSQELINLNN